MGFSLLDFNFVLNLTTISRQISIKKYRTDGSSGITITILEDWNGVGKIFMTTFFAPYVPILRTNIGKYVVDENEPATNELAREFFQLHLSHIGLFLTPAVTNVQFYSSSSGKTRKNNIVTVQTHRRRQTYISTH